MDYHQEKYPEDVGHSFLLIIKTIEIHATINAKRMYELFGFYVKSEIHDDYDGDVYIMEYCHSSVCYSRHSVFYVFHYAMGRLLSTSRVVIQFSKTHQSYIHLTVYIFL